ncbi:MAG: HD domain-containing protein [Armatimonadetes bacterium]|nr:HD domain-containing protein [Armatimonadota bacterium]
MELSKLHVEAPPELLRLAERCRYEEGHTLQVLRLALALFDELQKLHRMPPEARRILMEGALLHDIGWCKGRKGHHKSSYSIAVSAELESVPSHELDMAAQVGRYHRKSAPSLEHAPFARLGPQDRDTVTRLSAILRVADGLDRGHQNIVTALRCEVTDREVTVHLECAGNAELEIWGAQRKAGLFERVFQRRLVFVAVRRLE